MHRHEVVQGHYLAGPNSLQGQNANWSQFLLDEHARAIRYQLFQRIEAFALEVSRPGPPVQFPS